MNNPGLAFAILLLVTLLWMSVPLIPAFSELIRPRDAAPLDAVGNDAGDLTYFAESFLARATAEGLLGPTIPRYLSDDTQVLVHSTGQLIAPDKKVLSDVAVIVDGAAIPDGTELLSETLARVTLHGSAGSTYRALLGMRDVYLGPGSTVLRWVHAAGRLEVAENCHLFGRATANRQIVLSTGVAFDRLESDVVRVTDVETAPTPILPTGAFERFIPRKATEMGPNYWRVLDDVNIPAGNILSGSLIASGSIVVGDGARLSGSIKSHEEIVVRTGAVIAGSISARGTVTIEAGGRVIGPVISETAKVVEAAIVGEPGKRTTITAPTIRLMPGATIHGAVMAGEEGLTMA